MKEKQKLSFDLTLKEPVDRQISYLPIDRLSFSECFTVLMTREMDDLIYADDCPGLSFV